MTPMNQTRALFALTLLSVPAAARAQDVPSGPEKGAKVPALKVYDSTGEHKDKTVDYAAERADKPTVYLLLRADKFDRPMNRFMKELDKSVKKDFTDAYVVAVWLTEDAEKTKELLPRVQQSVGYEVTALTCFAGDVAGPKDWNVNADAHLTVVVANKRKVAATFGYKSVNETDVPGVHDALRKAREGK
jgi:hypothetical protein